MKLAVFFPASLFSAWACSYGLVECLRRMGHEVTGIPVDPQSAALASKHGVFDAVIISGPEHIGSRCHVLNNDLPKIAWLHETVEREDYGKLDIEAIKRSADIVFCPAIQDEKYGFRYLPFGVDTKIFNPGAREFDHDVQISGTIKSIDAAFIGLLYPKRQVFLKELKSHGVNLVTGNVQVLELGGVNPRRTAELYAENIRKIKVFVNLPTLSQLAVTKIYEVLACGTTVITPILSPDHMDNLRDLPVIAYDSPERCAQLIKAPGRIFAFKGEVLGDEYRDPRIAHVMHDQHRLELRCEALLSALKELGAPSSHESLTTA